MDSYKLVLAPSATWTRVLLMHGPDEVLRAVLPPPSRVRHERAAMTLLEGISLWLDTPIPVVLSANERDTPCCLGLTDELGVGARSVFFRVDVEPRETRRRRGTRLPGVGDFADLRQLGLFRDGR